MGRRELFPLPHAWRPPDKPGRSRGRLNRAVDSLNWMAGCSLKQCSLPASPMQAEVLDRLDGLAACQQPNGKVPSGEEALRALLRGGSPYDWKGANESLTSYQAELV